MLEQRAMKPEKFLNDLLEKVIGLEGIVIADREGIPLINVTVDKTPESALMSGFLSTFGYAAHQGSKLGIGATNTSICFYSSYQVVQMELQGLSITFLGKANCNTGHILSIVSELTPMLPDLRNVLASEGACNV